jgi:hypothetical protein
MQIKRKLSPCSLTARINDKLFVLPEAILRLNTMPIKISMALFTDREATPKFIRSHKRTQGAKAVLSKSEAGGLTLPAF